MEEELERENAERTPRNKKREGIVRAAKYLIGGEEVWRKSADQPFPLLSLYSKKYLFDNGR